MKFRTTILQSGASTTGIEVPEEIVLALAAGRRPKVKVTLGGHTYRSSIATMGGRPMVGVSAVVRGHTGVTGGDVVDVDIELDTEPRSVELPPELEHALRTHPELGERLRSLSYSAQRRLVEPIAAAKGAETRSRRVAKALVELEKPSG
jgi:hypothetical protein